MQREISQGWRRVTRESPCPICKKPDWCSVSQDGRVAYCMRVESNRPIEGGMPGWIHKLDGKVKASDFSIRQIAKPRLTDKQLHAEWGLIARRLHSDGRSKLPRLAEELGVSVESLDKLGVGYGVLHGTWCWTWPERSAKGLIVGISRRIINKGKKQAKGSRRGLTYIDGWADRPGPILIVEGGSDVAACLTMGRTVIGRPSNIATCGDALATLLKQANPQRKVIVVGENDRREIEGHRKHCPGCRLCWPGKAGAVYVTQRLRRQLKPLWLGRIFWLLPPDGAKDVREWLNGQNIDPNDRPEVVVAGLKLFGGCGQFGKKAIR